MIRDPIVEEIHQVRERLWEECGGDFNRYLARLRERTAVEPGRIVTLEERRNQKRSVPPQSTLDR